MKKALPLLLAAITLAFAWILWPFLGAILWAAALAIVFHPLHERISMRMRGRRTLAALVTSILAVLVVICPLALIAGMVVQEAIGFYHLVQAGGVNLSLPGWAAGILGRWGVTSLASLREAIPAALEKNVPFVTFHALAFWHDSLTFGANLLAMLSRRRAGSGKRSALPLMERWSSDSPTTSFARFSSARRRSCRSNVVFFSTLGGITVLGLAGFLLGPIIAAMFMVAWDTVADGNKTPGIAVAKDSPAGS